ncbi:MAG: hypothetical protein ACREQM_01380 [Candidatus Dormibacteraceae bacterium]
MATHRDDYATDEAQDPNDPRLGPVALTAYEKARLAEYHTRKRAGTLPRPVSTEEALRLLGLDGPLDTD